MQPASINLGKPKLEEIGKINVAIEEAFSTLLAKLIAEGIALKPVDGLMYLPDASAIVRFSIACRSVIDCLRLKS